MTNDDHNAVATKPFQTICNALMASCLGVMAVAVFINVVLRYGFGSGIAASEELSRLLFVWMVLLVRLPPTRLASIWRLHRWLPCCASGPLPCGP